MIWKDRLVPTLASLAPALVALALVGHFWTAGPRDFVPTWNDEIVYWTEIASFATAALDGGYFTIHEQPPAIPFSPFGAHGPLFPAAVGAVGHVFGWRVYSGFVFNLVVVTLAAGVWVHSVRPRVGAGTAALFLASFWPITFYLPSNMQEPLHFAIAMLFAATLTHLPASRSRALPAACVALLILASMLRPTWALLTIPILWIQLPSHRLLAVPLGIAVTAAAYTLFNLLAAPFPNSLNTLIAQAPAAPLAVIGETTVRLFTNLQRFMSPWNGAAAEVALRYEVAALLTCAGVLAWRQPRDRGVLTVAVLIVAVPVAAVLVAGWVETWRDFRAIAPALLLALLVCGADRPGWLRVTGLANVMVGLAVIPSFVDLHAPRFTADRSSIAAFTRVVSPHLTFEPDAPRWDNTVLMHVDLVQHPVLGLPPGIGLSFVLDWGAQAMPPRSRYLLLRLEEAEQIGRQHSIEPLAKTPLGTLYLNGGATRVTRAGNQ